MSDANHGEIGLAIPKHYLNVCLQSDRTEGDGSEAGRRLHEEDGSIGNDDETEPARFPSPSRRIAGAVAALLARNGAAPEGIVDPERPSYVGMPGCGRNQLSSMRISVTRRPGRDFEFAHDAGDADRTSPTLLVGQMMMAPGGAARSPRWMMRVRLLIRLSEDLGHQRHASRGSNDPLKGMRCQGLEHRCYAYRTGATSAVSIGAYIRWQRNESCFFSSGSAGGCGRSRPAL